MRKFAFIIISSLVSFIGVDAQIRINSIRVAYPLYVASFIDTSMVESLRKTISISNAPFEFQKDSIYILEQEPYYELIRERTYGIVDYHKKSNKNTNGPVYFLTKDYRAYRSVWNESEWVYKFNFKIPTEYGTFYVRSFTCPDFIVKVNTITEYVLNATYTYNRDKMEENENNHLNLSVPFRYRLLYDKDKLCFNLIDCSEIELNNDSLNYRGYDKCFERFTIADFKEKK